VKKVGSHKQKAVKRITFAELIATLFGEKNTSRIGLN